MMPTPSQRRSHERVRVISTNFYHDVVADDEPIIRMQSRFGALRVAVGLRRALFGRTPQHRSAMAQRR